MIRKNGNGSELTMWRPRVSNLRVTSFCSSELFISFLSPCYLFIFFDAPSFFALSLLLQFLCSCKVVIGQTDWKLMQIQACYLTLIILFEQIKKK